MKILISGYYGFGNCGDEAVLRAIRQGFKTHNLTVIERKDRYSFFKIIGQMLRTDIFLSGGGTLFQNKTSDRSFYYYIGLVFLAKLFRRRVMIFAQGFGPLSGGFNRLIARLILDRTDLITLRDNNSLAELKKIGVTRPRIEVTADPAAILDIPPPEKGKKILELEGVKAGSRPLLGIAVRELPKDIMRGLAEIADWLAKTYDLLPVFIPFKTPDDAAPSSEIMSMMNEKSSLVFRNCEPGEMLSLFSLFDLVIGMRLHSLIFAAMNAVPMLGISYDPKVAAFMKEIEQPYIETEKPDGMKEALEKLIESKDNIRSALEKKREDLRAKARMNFSLAEGLFSR